MPTLQEEIRQRKPFNSAEEEAMLSIARTAAVLEHAAGEVLKQHGLTTTQYNALRILRGAGAEGLCRNEIRDRLISRVPDATRLLDRLEDTGLVTRSREGDDRRFVLTRITPAGLELLGQLDPEVAAMNRRLLGHLTQGKLRSLIDLLGEARSSG
ncbi:MAG TPA: MarR family transcriptional regulator [Gemmatimonadales bacterium]|nr:MarR family transcriptional regulator [Gemmatimonadales bacterium]